MTKKQKVLVVVGPTSSGKSALAVELARKFNGEVISADSRQVYRGLNIGTGKITKREMRGIRHHLLDEVLPHRIFTAHDFIEKAPKVIEGISGRGKLPIIAGGTGFYIDALLGRVAIPNVPPDQKLRALLEKKAVPELFKMLKRRDLRRAKTIEPHNKRRLIRALEIVDSLGKVPTHGDFVNPKNLDLRNPNIDPLWIGLTSQSKVRKKRIRARLMARMRRGMVREAERLHKAGLSYRRMEQLGLEYRALARLLQGRITREQMVDELNRDIRRYARRQLAYWKRNKNIKWFAPEQRKKISKIVENWLRWRAH
ncbi:tRNA (adenosine(37)-N6)-dimethylallyltransferase MiaA [Candidatus Kaiserbacteria bacterium RIFCSPLOWO2_01_FULL_54_13]|uniref:tRNA dimethylallyltransferase n=1 Tax=Candidatus Kaiserbacteria bacterium RIFCSPLOWO2_01_FULL_54_13 TaxID=1798512 RepID=A0A1F6F3W8_9BACT|nr:MAG: tRNA (adenosine(37)-N6)-dimethylallyltransferase MiaA [Candidatus Kaiserbacteria bacterium RIFCSPLOWO2_01_FULL_54_13]